MNKPIRILHVFAGLNCGGAENLVMNLYRHVDRTQIQFDFAYYKRFSDFFVREIQDMGGQVYRLPPPTLRHVFPFLVRWWRILSKQKTHQIIHGHAQATSIVYQLFEGLADRVVFSGFLPNVGRLMMAMDLFVLPSLYEGVPLTLIEAQCSGLPCLISDTIPCNIIQTSLVQALSLQEKEQTWADAMFEIVNHPQPQDRSYCHLPFRDTEYDIRVQASRYEQLIRNIVDNQKEGL